MRGSSWRRLAAIAAMCACAGAAQAGEAQPAQCEVPAAQGGAIFPDREETIATFVAQVPESCLKSLVVACGHTASRELLDPGTAAICSIGYEALLRKTFGGSFHAMLMWWRGDRAAQALVP